MYKDDLIDTPEDDDYFCEDDAPDNHYEYTNYSQCNNVEIPF